MRAIAVVILALMANAALPAALATEQDSAELQAVVVESSVLLESTARIEVDRADIGRISAASLGDLLAHVPNVKLQRNSRGEQVFALRGSDQRQVALTLDGAPMVSAWDGQLDLSLLPTSAIQRVAITRGPASVLQGPNALSGAVNVISRRSMSGGFIGALTANVGSDLRGLEGFVGHASGDHAFSAAVAWHEADGYEAGGESALLPGSDHRNGSAVLGWTFAYDQDASTAITILAVDNSKGVVPERTSGNPRFWRYPNLQKNMLVWYGRQPVAGGNIDYSFYLDRARSRIDQYTSDTYSSIGNVEDGLDRGGGGRVHWRRPLTATQELTLGGTWSKSRHLFRERASGDSFTAFSQELSAVAAEWRNSTGPWKLLLGTAYEHFRNPDTGPFPNPGSSDDWAATGAITYALTAESGLDFTIARKTRFPSLRESYNGALGRFVLNPDLGPETAESVALGLVGQEWEIRAFATQISDGITRVALPNRQFTRVNLTRSRIAGVEFAIGRQLATWLHGRLEGTFLEARAQSPDGDYSGLLEYRPGVNLGLELAADLPARWRANVSARYLAEEHGLLESSPTPQKLPSYLLWDISAERTFQASMPGEIALVLRLDNISDEYYETQWGLPGPGRSASFAVTWKW
jgi:iron complex outermembrane receptor protein